MKAIASVLAGFSAALAFGVQAHATTYDFNLAGKGFSISGQLTAVPDVSPPDPDALCGTLGHNACRADPPGALKVTSITGTFTDASDGIFGAAITGLIPISPAPERDPVFDPLVPTSLSFIDFPGGALSYNNLFFPNGSPIDCAFPFGGTLFDVFGVAFTVDGGYQAEVWGDGDLFGPGRHAYGAAVADARGGLTYVFNGLHTVSVPEPTAWLLMLIGFAGLGGGLRRARGRPAAAVAA
jgi:hypothetical protein